ncbi:MAG: glycerol-3-phosphate dehydrogenase [Betaproteobacteria bacterium]|nr:glycerol-3-phosphate dehydrogenase [Betaproteobacteria bacterium]
MNGDRQPYDLAVIGAGINGCGIARDAAGRGLKVCLIEQGDIASATSQWSSKMVHGGLRYLEHYEFRLVRESLQEREVMLRIAPHLVRPAEFIVPHDASMRPAWMVRAGLFLYDHIGGRISLPGSRTVPFPDARYSAGLKPVFPRGFFYSDTRVDDARLTLANAVSAREQGADVRVHTRLLRGAREGGTWRLLLADADTGIESLVEARGVVNAAGPWVKQVLNDALNVQIDATVRLVKGSHIVVPRVHAGEHTYLLQNADRRVIFVIPYEERFTLIGTTDVAIHKLDDAASISPAETDYLIGAVNRYLQAPIRREDIVWSYAGVRPLYDDGQSDPSSITRDYVLKVDAPGGELPLLSVFGGKLTTYRKLAEHAMAELAPYYPGLRDPWTATQVLPGGAGCAAAELQATLAALQAQHERLPAGFVAQVFRRHGDRTARVLGKATSVDQLGECVGSGDHLLCEAEVDFCIREEWARTAEDILWRRTKLGLHLDAPARAHAAAVCKRLGLRA